MVPALVASRKEKALSRLERGLGVFAKRFKIAFEQPAIHGCVPKDVRDMHKLEYLANWIDKLETGVLSLEEAGNTRIFRPIRGEDGEVLDVVEVSTNASRAKDRDKAPPREQKVVYNKDGSLRKPMGPRRK
mgnify:CR=1 FL=1